MRGRTPPSAAPFLRGRVRSRAMVDDRDRWWREGVLYQIYPRSYADSNGDGVGDLRGIVDRLDHLAWLGVDGIWLNPVTVSPDADWGYDVADYTGLQPARNARGRRRAD